MEQSSWFRRIVFWILGGQLFLTIALLPNLLLAWFYTGSTVHLIVIPTGMVTLGLIWVSQNLGKSS